MMLPPVARITIAYGAGLWIGLVVLVPAAAFWVVPLVVLVVAWRRGWLGALALAFGVGLVTGAGTAQRNASTCGAQWRSGTRAAVVRIQDAPGRRAVTSASVLHAPSGCRGTIRLRVTTGTVSAGSVAIVVGQYHAGNVLRVTHLRELRRTRSWRFRLRDTMARRIDRLYGERAGLVEAMVLGRRDDIPPALRSQFADAGVAHLLAISGLHVGILAGWLVLLCRWVGLRRYRWLLAAAFTWSYVLLLGFPAPASRAASFVTLYAVSRFRQRHPPPLAVLAIAVMTILQINPASVGAVGTWLSVAAVWGTSWGGRLLSSRLRRSPSARLVASSFGAVIATAPITAYAFGAVAPIGLVSNLVAIPLAGVAVPGVMASLLFGSLLAGGSGLVLLAIERVASLAAAVPGGHLTGVAGFGFAAPWFAVVGVVIWVARRRWNLARLRRKLLVGGTVASWAGVAVTTWPGSMPDGTLTIFVLDVGQGDAIPIRTPQGQWLLIDGGPRTGSFDAGRRVVTPFLRRRGVDRLSTLVISHADADHIGGVPEVLGALEVGMIVESGQPVGSGLYGEYLAAVDAVGIPWHAARRGDVITLDSVVFSVLHPTTDWAARESEPNENSVIIHVRYKCFDALLAGDVGRRVERALLGSLTEVEVLKVGHHGSEGSSSPEWLDALAPRAAVISVGGNRYGHPASAVLERLHDRGTDVWRTDRGGTVTISTDGSYLWIGQGSATSGALGERLRCRIQRLLRSNGSSSSRSGCTPRPPVISPICSTP